MKEKRDWYDYTIGICLIIVLAVIPLFVSAVRTDITISESSIRGGSSVTDVFSYYKSLALCFVAFFLGAVFLMFVPEKGYKKYNFGHPIFFCGLAFMFLAFISFIITPYKDIALAGISERYENVWVLLSYMVFMIITFKYCENQFRMRFIVFGIFLGAFIIGIVGYFQYLGMDFFETDLGTKYILGKDYTGKPITARFDEVYSFLYNPNCVGMFCALVLPFTLTLAVSLPVFTEKKFGVDGIFKVCAIILSFILACNLIGSSSEGGLIAVFCSLFMGAVIALIYILKNKKYKECSKIFSACITALVVVIILGAGYYVANNESVQSKIKDNIDIFMGNTQAKTGSYFQSFSVDNDKNRIDISTFENGGDQNLYVDYDERGQVVKLSDNKGIIGEFEFSVDAIKNLENKQEIFNATTFYGTELEVGVYLRKNDTIPFFDIKNGKVFIHFTVSDSGKISVTDNFYELYSPDKKAERIGFEGSETFGTGRGYIWSRSIPLVLLKGLRGIVFGSGPDSFSVVFPQYELQEKLMYLGNPYIIVDKPHNFYLQTAINTGLLSLIALGVLFILYIYRTIRSIMRDEVKDRLVISLKFAFLMGIVGYLIAALATDSTVSVSPAFWIMIGAGFAVTEFSGVKRDYLSK
ncbi:MAG: hypothetical protein HFE59_04600 [Clostridiales bacterium]|nr:hypothetical protein [Clostridiales bacterium]